MTDPATPARRVTFQDIWSEAHQAHTGAIVWAATFEREELAALAVGDKAAAARRREAVEFQLRKAAIYEAVMKLADRIGADRSIIDRLADIARAEREAQAAAAEPAGEAET